MTADQHADVNIELNEIAAAGVPFTAVLTGPQRTTGREPTDQV